MQLIEAFIRNPVKVAVGVLLVVMFGLIAASQMPVELTPAVERPTMSVRTEWPGAGPEEVEREIIYEQEKQLKSVPGLVKMTSRSSDSRGYVTMELAVGTKMSEALVKINTQLQQVQEYPEDAKEPVIRTSGESSRRVAYYSLIVRPPTDERIAEYQRRYPKLTDVLQVAIRFTNPTLKLERLRQLAKDHSELESLVPPEIDVPKFRRFAEQVLAAKLGRVDGVAQVWVWGGRDSEMQVVVDPRQLAARRLTITDVRDALRRENQDTPGGDFDEGKRRYVVRTMGRFRTPEQVENVILATRDEIPVYIRDVAQVGLGYKRPRGGARHFLTPSIRMGVVKEPGANIMDVMDGLTVVRDQLNEGILKQRGLMLHQAFDTTTYIDSALSLVKKNILVGGTLTLIVLLLFLRSIRTTLLVTLAIPVSIIGALLMMKLLGRTLNVISLAGMAFAVGMLVDNAVVVLENIYRHYQMGEKPATAALRGAKEVWGAALASTLTTLAVFIPVLFVQEEAGQLFRDIALAISCGVGLSLIVSVSVIPTVAARILPQRDEDQTDAAADGQTSLATDTNGEDRQNGEPASRDDSLPAARETRSGPVPAAARSATRWTAWLRPIDRMAGRLVDAVVGLNAWLQRTVWMRIAVVVGFVGVAVLLSVALMPPAEYLPKGNRNRISGRLTPPPGYNVQKGVQLGKVFHDVLRPYAEMDPNSPEAKNSPVPLVDDFVYGTYGRSVWLGIRTVDPTRVAELLPILRKVADDLVDQPAISISQSSLFQSGWARSSRSIDIEISGPDLVKLVALGKQIRDDVEKLIPGSQTFPRPSLDLASPELHVIPKKEQASAMRMSSADLGYTVNALVDGAYASDYFHEGEQIDLTIIGKQGTTTRTQDISAVPIAVPTGQIVPLGAVGDVRWRTGPDEIVHIERERGITIAVTPPDEVALGEAMQIIEEKIVQPLEQSGQLQGIYQVNLSGTADQLRATWAALKFNLIIALMITYLLMAGLFESWLYPLVIMVSVPLAAVGGLAGLRFMNLFVLQQLDVLTMLGFIILVGTVVNNAILIVHQSLNNMRDHDMPAEAAMLASVRTRVRPIFMTTFTTTFGLVPLVLFPGAGSELYRGLGSVVLGGLLTATIFTLVLVPTLFSLTMELKAWFAQALGRQPKFKTAPSSEAPQPAPTS